MQCTRVATAWVLGKKKPLFFSCSKQKCMKLKKKKWYWKKKHKVLLVMQKKAMLFYLFISFLGEVTRDRMLCL